MDFMASNRNLSGSFAAAAAPGAAAGSHKLLKKFDQNSQTKKVFNVYLFFTWNLW